MDLYTRIQELCRQKGLTLPQLAELAGINPVVLEDLKEGNTRTVTLHTAKKIADALHVPPTVLIGSKIGDGSETDLFGYLEGLRANPRRRTLFALTKDATKEDIDTALRIVENFIDNYEE